MSSDVKIGQQRRICLGVSDTDLSTMTWCTYNESTKHSVESLRRASHVLDWANMPDPFRHYEGVPLLDLPADPPIPETPALEVLQGISGATPAKDGPTFLSQLLFYSASISASKLVPSTGHRYALRVNPSSGNLHPTEFHFLTRGLKEWPDGLYHYRPSAHLAEQRALGDLNMKFAGGSAPIVFVLTSLAWREAWKCRDRAYRYCLHDIGHAWQALALALVRHWSLIQIGAATPPPLNRWHIISREFRENLEWAVVVPGDGETSPAVTALLGELSARGITIHDSRFGPW